LRTTELSEGYSILYAYDVQPDYNTSSQEISSTYNPHVRHENDNNSQFGFAISLIFGSSEQYPPWYFDTNNDKVIQPAQHSF
jgi:hypothetical protein